MINLQVISIILNIISLIFCFLAGFFFGRTYEMRKISKEIEKMLKDRENKPLKGGDLHGKTI